jgi:hypothetical protein
MRRMPSVCAIPVLCASLLASPAVFADTGVYGQDFESGSAGAAWTGAGAVQSAGSLPGFGALHLYNGGTLASVLSLTDLPTHTDLTLVFDLAIWDSVDGNPGGYPYGDTFELTIDGNTVISTLFGNYGTPGGQSLGPGIEIAPNNQNYGYGGWVDSARRVTVTLPHTASTAVFGFQFPNAQGGSDEGFGLDNLQVSVTPVPEPGSWALMGLGLFALGRVARRQRATTGR